MRKIIVGLIVLLFSQSSYGVVTRSCPTKYFVSLSSIYFGEDDSHENISFDPYAFYSNGPPIAEWKLLKDYEITNYVDGGGHQSISYGNTLPVADVSEAFETVKDIQTLTLGANLKNEEGDLLFGFTEDGTKTTGDIDSLEAYPVKDFNKKQIFKISEPTQLDILNKNGTREILKLTNDLYQRFYVIESHGLVFQKKNPNETNFHLEFFKLACPYSM